MEYIDIEKKQQKSTNATKSITTQGARWEKKKNCQHYHRCIGTLRLACKLEFHQPIKHFNERFPIYFLPFSLSFLAGTEGLRYHHAANPVRDRVAPVT
jgi:hypothetical protein